jgi:hypothetical protein
LGHFQSPHHCSLGEEPEAEIQTEALPGKHYETTLALRQSINVHVYRAALLQLITSLPNRAAATVGIQLARSFRMRQYGCS